MTAWRTLVATADDEGERLDVVVGRRFADVSRRAARAYGLDGRLFVQGRRAAPSHRVRAGERIELRLRDLADDDDAAASLRLLAITPRFVYALKPAGQHVHRLRPDDPPALADAVARRFAECAGASIDPREGGAVHRLDGPTSGVVAFARDRGSFEHARAGFSAGEIEKVYVAWCRAGPRQPWPPSPRPAAATLDRAAPWRRRPIVGSAVAVVAPLGPTPDRGVGVRADGQPAHTDVWCVGLRRRPTHADALMILRLHTGRRHQARVHLALLGWPILGDTRYGPPISDANAMVAPRLMLHAWRLDLRATVSTERAVTAPWPVALCTAWGRPGPLDRPVSTP